MRVSMMYNISVDHICQLLLIIAKYSVIHNDMNKQ
jgi:hypothetical protein